MAKQSHRQRHIASIALFTLLLFACTACTTTSNGGCVVVAITVTPAAPGNFIGDTIRFTATAFDQNGDPCGTAIRNWTTSDASIVLINSFGLATMLFNGNTLDYPASITITATDSTSGSSDSAILTVSNPVATVVITSSPPPTLTACQSFGFTAQARDIFNAPLVNVPILWDSSDLSVATISRAGLATATGDGSANITAMAYGIVSSPDTLTVSGGSPITIMVVPPSSTIPAGSSGPMAATVTGFSVDDSVTWSVDGGAADGTVTPIGPNDATYITPFNYAGFPAPAIMTVRATSNENPDCSSTADVTVIPTFQAATQFGGGGTGNAQALVVGQFSVNLDTNLDVAAVNQNVSGVSIWRGDGTGQLNLSSTMLTPGTDVAIAQGFFDSGVLPDLAILNLISNQIHSLLGTGAGTFNPATPPTTSFDGVSPKSITAGDFDHDDDDDLAVTIFDGRAVLTLESNGDGTFTPIAERPFINQVLGITNGLINGDVHPDLAITDFSGNKIRLMMGNGTIAFGSNSSISLPVGTGPADIVIANFDGGFNDLAIVNRGQLGDTCPPPVNPKADKVTILSGLGNGSFLAPVTFPVESNPRTVATSDFNKDGHIDLVVTNFCSDTVSVLFGNGDGTFQSAINYTLGHPGSDRPTDVAVGDLNNDSFDDIIATNSGTDSISVLLNNN